MQTNRGSDTTQNNGLIFVSAYPPAKGRNSEFAEALINELKRKISKEITLFTTKEFNCNIHFNEKKIKIIPTFKPDDLFDIAKLGFKIAFFKSRLIHFNFHMRIFGKSRISNFLGLTLLPILAKISKKKVIVTLHDVPDNIILEKVNLKNNVINRIGIFLAVKILVKFTDIVVVQVKNYVKKLKERYGCRNVVWIPHGAWFTDIPQPWKNNNSNYNILFIGYLNTHKNIEILTLALQTLKEKYPKIQLIIAGRPHPDYPDEILRIKNLISQFKFVKYVGYIPKNKVPDFIKKIRLAVLPYSTCTGTSGIVYFLSGLGIPIITSNAPEFLELKKQEAGILPVKLNPKDIAEAIEKIFEDEQLADDLSRKTRNFALNNSWCKIADAYMELYRKLENA